MNKEVAFQPKMLWVGAIGAVAGASWAASQPDDGSMELWLSIAISAFVGFVVFTVATLYLVQPYAVFKHAVLGEGLPRKTALQLMFIEYGVLALGGYSRTDVARRH